MIRNLFFTLSFLIYTSVLFTQNISFGIKGGLNIASVSTDFTIVQNNQEPINRFYTGLFANIGVSNKFSIQPGLFYNGKGLAFDADNHSHTIRLKSIDMPIHAIYHITKGFYVGAGINLGYYLSGTNSNEGGNHDHTIKYEFDGDPFEYKRWDLGLSSILGYKHDSGTGISLGYIIGVNNVAVLPDNSWKSNVLNVSLTYDFLKIGSSN